MMSRKLYGIVAAAFVITFSCALAIAAPSPSPSPKSDADSNSPKLTGEYADIAKEAKVTDAHQLGELAKIQLEQETSLKAYDAAHKAQVDDLEKKRLAAKDTSKDGPTAALKKIATDRDAVIMGCRIKAFNRLNADQKVLFTIYRLSTIINEHFKALALTDEQKTKVADIIAADAKKMEPKDTYNMQAVGQVETEAMTKVLDENQRNKYNEQKLRDPNGTGKK